MHKFKYTLILTLSVLGGCLLLPSAAKAEAAAIKEAETTESSHTNSDDQNNDKFEADPDTSYAEDETSGPGKDTSDDIPNEIFDLDSEESRHDGFELDSETVSQDSEEKNLYSLKTLTVTKSKFVADTFRGVSALYRPGGNDGTNSTYSCAAYIKRFYSKVHNVSVYNLNTGCTPLTREGKRFQKVSTPKAGDIIRFSGHWAIVKKVNSSSKSIVLIEQNWKWMQGKTTLCKINRTVSWNSGTIFRLK